MPSSDDGGSLVDHNRDAEAGRTIARVYLEHGIQVSLNPLVVPAVKLLLQDMAANVSSMVTRRGIFSHPIIASKFRALS